MQFPPRTPEAEEAFIVRFRDGTDTTDLQDVIHELVLAGRLRLAARLVGLLEDSIEIEEGSPLDRARRAARFIVFESAPTKIHYSDFEDAWHDHHRARVARIKHRMRQRYAAPDRTGHGRRVPGRRKRS